MQAKPPDTHSQDWVVVAHGQLGDTPAQRERRNRVAGLVNQHDKGNHNRACHEQDQPVRERHAVHEGHEGFDDVVHPVRHMVHIGASRTSL